MEKDLDQAYAEQDIDTPDLVQETPEGSGGGEFRFDMKEYQTQLIDQDQASGEAQKADQEAQAALLFPETPIPVDLGKMQETFNTDLNEEERQAPLLANIENVPPKNDGEVVLNTDFLQAVEAGDKAKAVEEELKAYLSGESGGVLQKTFEIIDYIFAPAMAPLAAVEGALANTPATGSFLGDLLSQGVAAGDAFNERAFRWFNPEGEMMPFYAEKIVEKYLPGVPEEHRASTGMVLELLLTIPTGVGMAKSMQKAISMTTQLDRTKDFAGIMKESIYSYLGWKPGQEMGAETKAILAKIGDGTPDEVAKQLLEDAERVQKFGDKAAYVKLNEQLGLTKGKDNLGTEEAMQMVTKLMGDASQNSVLVKRATDQGELTSAIKERSSFNDVRFNLTSTYDFDDFNKTLDEATAALAENYRRKNGMQADVPSAEGGFVSRPNAEAIATARKSQLQLETLMGVPVQRMAGAEADALKVILAGSMKQLGEYVAIMNSPGASTVNKELAKTAFAKQLINHNMISAKIRGFHSVAGQNLGSANRDYYNELLAQMNIKRC